MTLEAPNSGASETPAAIPGPLRVKLWPPRGRLALDVGGNDAEGPVSLDVSLRAFDWKRAPD